VEDPSILGLGKEVAIKSVEKVQPKAGRLDLLMFDRETEKRFEVELMLGAVDESHIIRCIEYWDIERKRYPLYDHVAVLVAESITTRFLNVIGLFNNAIPLIAIQLNALKVNDHIVLDFVKVLDEVIPGEDDEEPSASTTTDRGAWERETSKGSLAVVDHCIEIIRTFAPQMSPNYKQEYIGLADEHGPRNFVLFYAKKQFVRAEVRLADHEPWRQKLEEAGLVVIGSLGNWFRFRLNEAEVGQHQKLLTDLFSVAYKEYQD
jgi:hypothetical protein